MKDINAFWFYRNKTALVLSAGSHKLGILFVLTFLKLNSVFPSFLLIIKFLSSIFANSRIERKISTLYSLVPPSTSQYGK